ncbi:rod shape-determining protein MreC [Limisphaera sp. VF-2]|jgi:rod shape-determining protein MreC|uniref:rod shape-determining protein MreC n=1 Tax=Limisphaera sp. VF-2 TaxID=3400418 RepID=UPI001759DBFB
MWKRSHSVALGLVAGLSLALLSLPEEWAARFKVGWSALYLPLLGLAGAAQQAVPDATGMLLSRRELLRQNEQLRRENQQLRLEALQAAEWARENARLRRLLGWQEQSPWRDRLRLARVTLRDPTPWWRSLTIDLGSRHGVHTGLPVLTPEGLVGRTAEVGPFHARVVLVGDPNCRVSAQVLNGTGDTGLIIPAGPLDPDLVLLSYLPRAAVVRPGQGVVTSGLGGLFPKGIPIGTVVDVRPVENGLYLEARVKLAAPLHALHEVWVLWP